MKCMTPPKARGLTLIEVLIATSMSAVIIAGGVAAVIGFTNSERHLAQKRVTGQQLRRAMAKIKREVSSAGFGLDPSIAFDPHRPDVDCSNGVCKTDAAVAGGTYQPDDLLFAFRDPNYFAAPKTSPRNNVATDFSGMLWKIVGTTSSSITVAANANPVDTELLKGTVLLAICPGGFSYALATLSAPTSIITGGPIPLPLEPVDAANPFQQFGAAAAANPCFDANGRLFIVNRYRYMLRKDPKDPTRRFLVLSRSLDRSGPAGIPDGKIDLDDWELVASNIEDMQIVHIMRDGTVLGDAAAPDRPTTPTVITLGPGVPSRPCSDELTLDFYKATALAPCSLSDAQRSQSDLWGNTVRLRLNLVARSRKVLRASTGVQRAYGLRKRAAFKSENSLRTGGIDGYSRERLSVVIPIPNINARGVPLI